jgi:alcohol dehydrogenase (cytochrome c)
LVTQAGREIHGCRVNEDTFTLQVCDLEGILHSIAKIRVKTIERLEGASLMPDGRLVFPNGQGASNWQSASYSPKTGLFYQRAREMRSVYFKGDAEYRPGTSHRGGGARHLYGEDAFSPVLALEATTGRLKWEFKLITPGFTSLLSTAGGLVFGGTEEVNVFALNDEAGAPRWDLQLGGPVRGIPISYSVGGHQHVAIAAGNALFVFRL